MPMVGKSSSVLPSQSSSRKLHISIAGVWPPHWMPCAPLHVKTPGQLPKPLVTEQAWPTWPPGGRSSITKLQSSSTPLQVSVVAACALHDDQPVVGSHV